jgi:hypothetical protein
MWANMERLWLAYDQYSSSYPKAFLKIRPVHLNITDMKANDTWSNKFHGTKSELDQCNVTNKTGYSFVFQVILLW